MALERLRYRMELPFELAKIQAQAGTTVAIVGQTQGQIIDLDVDTATVQGQQNLDAFMFRHGYTLIAGPGVTGTPADFAEFVRRSGETMDSGADITMAGGGTIKGVPFATAGDEIVSLDQLNALVVSGRIWKEPLLVVNQLLDGGSGGILQAILAFVAATLTVGDVFRITDGIATETFTAVASSPGANQFIAGVSQAADQTALVQAINNDGVLWAATELSKLDKHFASAPAAQFAIYRRSTSSNADRVFGTLFSASSIKVVEFASKKQDYASDSGTESDLPSVDPASKRFGFGRVFASLTTVETHFTIEDTGQWTWSEDDSAWQMTGGTSAVAEPPLIWGADDVSNSTTKRFLYPTYVDEMAQTIRINYRVSRPGTMRLLRARHNVVGAAATLITYALAVNTVPSTLSAALAANANDANDLASSVVVSTGDLVSMEVTKAASLAGIRPKDILVSLLFGA